jgi:hypothetical protein
MHVVHHSTWLDSRWRGSTAILGCNVSMGPKSLNNICGFNAESPSVRHFPFNDPHKHVLTERPVFGERRSRDVRPVRGNHATRNITSGGFPATF